MKLKKIINFYKPVGMTPLQAIEKFRKNNPEYNDVKIGYAGRLDPMAQGVLVLLIGDENKKIRKYFGLDKEYEVEILFGFFSDTYDILGIAENMDDFLVEVGGLDKLKQMIRKSKGWQIQELPAYSSYKIKGKPLFYYARHNKLSEIKIPKNKIKIKKIKINFIKKIKSDKLLKRILKKIDLVKGDFRQEKIKNKWKRLLKGNGEQIVVGLNIKCTSGTYIRSIANELGGVLFGLVRTRVGRFKTKK